MTCVVWRCQGNRQDIKGLGTGSQKVLNEVLYLIDKYDLYGHVAYPKTHSQSDISVSSERRTLPTVDKLFLYYLESMLRCLLD